MNILEFFSHFHIQLILIVSQSKSWTSCTYSQHATACMVKAMLMTTVLRHSHSWLMSCCVKVYLSTNVKLFYYCISFIHYIVLSVPDCGLEEVRYINKNSTL